MATTSTESWKPSEIKEGAEYRVVIPKLSPTEPVLVCVQDLRPDFVHFTTDMKSYRCSRTYFSDMRKTARHLLSVNSRELERRQRDAYVALVALNNSILPDTVWAGPGLTLWELLADMAGYEHEYDGKLMRPASRIVRS